jgi:hypothetical protein
MNNNFTLSVTLGMSSLSILSSFADKQIIALLALSIAVISTLSYLRSRKGNGKAALDAVQFISNLSMNSRYQKSTLAVLKKSVNPAFVFYPELSRAIDTYRYSSSTKGISALASKYNVGALSEAFGIIVDSLENGSDMHLPITELKQKIYAVNGKRLSNAKMQSMGSIVKLGAMVFFPLFAGISLEITRITSVIGGAAEINTAALSIILMLYIASVNNSIVKYSVSKGSALSVASYSSLQIAAALLIFRLSYAIGGMMLRW